MIFVARILFFPHMIIFRVRNNLTGRIDKIGELHVFETCDNQHY